MNPGRTLAWLATSAGMAAAVHLPAPSPLAAPLPRGQLQPTRDPAAPQDPLDALRAASRNELDRPNGHITLDPPPGVDPARLAPIDPSSREGLAASMALEDLIKGLLAKPAIEPKPVGDPPPTPVLTQALRLYALGREKAAAGDAAGAVVDLEQAARFNPSAGEIWRELGDAQVAAGRRLAANSSYTQACQHGIQDARLWWILGRDSLRAKKLDQAAAFLAAARSMIDASTDPALEYILEADLGDCFLQLGHLKAGIEAIARGTSFPTPLPWSTRLRAEVIDLLRRRADLRRDAGDAAVRLGDTLSALDLYDHAAEDGQLESSVILFRKVHALWSSGRPAATAELLLEDMATGTSPVSDTHIALVRKLALDPSAGPLLAPAIHSTSLRAGVQGQTARLQWIRASAAALPLEEARKTLRQALAEDPDADELFTDLLLTLPRNDPRARVDELLGLIDHSPRAILLITRLMATTSDADGELSVLSAGKPGVAAILRVHWLLGMGRAQDAAKAADSLSTSTLTPYALAAKIEALCATGRYDQVGTLLDSLRASSPQDNPILLARTLLSCQRITSALEALPAPSSEAAGKLSPEQRLSAAGISLRANRPDAAEAHALHVLGADPFNDRAYEILVAIYGPGSPMASEEKLAQTMRLLRQTSPDSQVVRWLTAQEMLERRMDAQAQEVLTGLIDSGSTAEPVVAGLASVLERRVALGGDAALQAVNLSRQLVARYPEVPHLWSGLGRVMAAQGKGEEVDAELALRYAQRPWPILAATREAILRDVLKKPDAARAMAMARLSPTPRTIDATVSYAGELYRGGSLDDAVATLAKDLPPESQLTTDQQSRLAALIAAEYEAADRAGGAPVLKRKANAGSIAGLFSVLADHGARFAPQMHEARIALLCDIQPVDVAALQSACLQAARDVPGLASAAYARAAQHLINLNKSELALPFLREAIRNTKTPGDQLLRAYFVQVAKYGAAPDVEELSSIVGGVAGERKVLEQLRSDEKLPVQDDLLHTEFLYRFAGTASIFERRDLAIVALQAVLRLDPDHPMANNDLGYFYLEDGKQQSDAQRLLEHAYKLQPDSHNVVDSFGWLRYQQGFLEDRTDPATNAPSPGAASLLAKAAQMQGGLRNPTIQDHLGDVLWRQGHKDRAAAAWRRAEAVLTESITEALRSAEEHPESAASIQTQIALIRAELDPIQAKLKAVEAGTEPPVAPMRWADAPR